MKSPIIERLIALSGTTTAKQFAIKLADAIELAKLPGCPAAIVARAAECNRPTPPLHVLIRRHELETLAAITDNATTGEGGEPELPAEADS